MGFISFNEKYYLEKLNYYESKELNKEELTEAKRLLKVLDDLEEEGYTKLSARLESLFGCKYRLNGILAKYGQKPFPAQTPHKTAEYDDKEWEAAAFFDRLIKSKCNCPDYKNDFLKEIISYSQWIGYSEDTAYIFLLRDAFLPYVYFKSRGRQHLYPWIIGRAFINQMADSVAADDEFRLPIYEALEEKIFDFSSFAAYCKKRILKTPNKYPVLKKVLFGLLSGVHEEKICVVESGYCGTIPMLLSALDKRVDFRLYSTAPFLFKTYEEKIFCRKYENIRKFETLFVNDALFAYSRFDNDFYIKTTADKYILQMALSEIYNVSL